jgi:ABC-type transport system involved in multi-copper enzyme maturation permease subunit
MIPFLFANAKLTAWITPVWLISVGVAVGVVILALFYAVLRLANRRVARAFSDGIVESWLLPVFYLSLFLCLLSLVALPAVPYQSILHEVARIPSVGPATTTIEVPQTTGSFKFPMPFSSGEIQQIELESNRPLTVYTYLSRGAGQDGEVELYGGKSFSWRRAGPLEKPFDPEFTTEWTARNTGEQPATLTLRTVTDIAYPQVRVIPVTAAALIVLVTIYMLLRLLAPKVSAIALAAAKESMGQPLFYMVLLIGSFMLVGFIYVPYNTFGEDIKMLKDSGLTTIMLGAILLAVWSASTSISDEIEGRTALTLLSKPISRRTFVIGKFLGIVGPVVLVHILLGFLLLATVSYKVVYDARETAQLDPTWQLCFNEMIRTVPGMLLSLYETLVLAAISVAMSTRLPMVANLLVCATIYVLGHLAPMIVNSSMGKFPIVEFFGQLIATVLPNLDHFNIQAAIAAGADVPGSYLVWALVYCVLFCLGALLLALALFEDRDLA